MIDLTGKSALVTGGSRGIGRACCEILARAGAKVAVNYRVETPWADLVAQRIEEAGGTAFALSADVSVREEAEMLVDETVDRFGGLDILVNNAGIWKGSPIEEISDGEWSEMIGVNLSGTFHVIRSAVPHDEGPVAAAVSSTSRAPRANAARPCTATTRRPRARCNRADQVAGRRNWLPTASASTASPRAGSRRT